MVFPRFSSIPGEQFQTASHRDGRSPWAPLGDARVFVETIIAPSNTGHPDVAEWCASPAENVQKSGQIQAYGTAKCLFSNALDRNPLWHLVCSLF